MCPDGGKIEVERPPWSWYKDRKKLHKVEWEMEEIVVENKKLRWGSSFGGLFSWSGAFPTQGRRISSIMGMQNGWGWNSHPQTPISSYPIK